MCTDPRNKKGFDKLENPEEPLECLPGTDDLKSVRETGQVCSSDSVQVIRKEIKESLEKSLVDHADIWEALSKL
jgi:hypothetical protein